MASLLLLALLCGCERRHPDKAGAEQRFHGFIAFVGAGEYDPLWPILKASAQRYAEPALVPVRYFSPQSRSPQAQIELLRSLTGSKMRGVCLQVLDPRAINSAVEDLASRGIPVVSMLQPIPAALRAGHVGFEDLEIGRALAEATAAAIGQEGTIMLLHAGLDDPVYGPRLVAFDHQIAEYPKINVFARLDCQRDPVLARRIIRERSERYPRLSAWVALDDWPIRDSAELDDIMPAGCKFITFGGTPAQWSLIRSGRCPAVVAADYSELGAKAVQFCEAALQAASRFDNRYNAPLRTVWLTNLEAYVHDWTVWSTSPATTPAP